MPFLVGSTDSTGDTFQTIGGIIFQKASKVKRRSLDIPTDRVFPNQGLQRIGPTISLVQSSRSRILIFERFLLKNLDWESLDRNFELRVGSIFLKYCIAKVL